MKILKNNHLLWFALFFCISLSLSSCEFIGGVFKAGVWFGVAGVVLVIALVIWLIGRAGGKD